MHLVRFLDAIEVGLEELLKAWVRSPSLLDEGDLVANTEAILEEERAAQALKGTLAHNSNTVSEHVGFVHIVSSQDNDSVFFVRLEHIPEISSCAKIHTRGRLVKKDES